MKLSDVTIGVSPLTNQVYVYKSSNKNGGQEDVDEKKDITGLFIGCCDILLRESEKGHVKFTVNDEDGVDREFYLTESLV
jgi:hypothetical protein